MQQHSEREVLRDAAILQIIAGELGAGRAPEPDRLAEMARALNAMASGMLADGGRSANA